MTKRPTNQADMLAYLREHPGSGSGAICAGLGWGRDKRCSVASAGLNRMCAMGVVGYVKEGKVRLYYARDACPPGAVLVDKVQPLGRTKPVRTPQDHQRMVIKSGRKGAPRPEGEEIITARTKVTIWVPPPDPREAKIPPPSGEFIVRFADLGPGRYLDRDTLTRRRLDPA